MPPLILNLSSPKSMNTCSVKSVTPISQTLSPFWPISTMLLLQTRPPSVWFKINNQIDTALSLADLRSLVDIFSRHARVILFPNGNLAPGKVYPVGALMRQTSTDFYKWYTAESKTTTRIPVLGFKLLGLHRNVNQSFLVDAANLECFQMLKQNIWDSFWYTLYSNGAPPLFEISVSHLLANAPDCTTRLPSRDMPAGSSVNTDAGFGSAPRVQLAACESEKTTRKRSDVYQLLN